MIPSTVSTIIDSMGTGYSPPPRPNDAFDTAVSGAGTRMLSALVATNAIPRSTHIVPSVMMNGWTRSPTTSAPFSTPHASPTPRQTRRPSSVVAVAPIGPAPRRKSAIATPESA